MSTRGVCPTPGSTLVLRLNQETIHDFILPFLHHATRSWPRWPPVPSNQADLSSPHLEASSAMTFHACSSPAPTPVKPQPAPAILSQESADTTLSITHHTMKRPSTGPQTTHDPHPQNEVSTRGQSPPVLVAYVVVHMLAWSCRTI
jgi:hypothetical protein